MGFERIVQSIIYVINDILTRLRIFMFRNVHLKSDFEGAGEIG